MITMLIDDWGYSVDYAKVSSKVNRRLHSKWLASQCGQNILVRSKWPASGQNILVWSGQNIGILRPRPNPAPASWRLLLDLTFVCQVPVFLGQTAFKRFPLRILGQVILVLDCYERFFSTILDLLPLPIICSIHCLKLNLLLSLKTIHDCSEYHFQPMRFLWDFQNYLRIW